MLWVDPHPIVNEPKRNTNQTNSTTKSTKGGKTPDGTASKSPNKFLDKIQLKNMSLRMSRDTTNIRQNKAYLNALFDGFISDPYKPQVSFVRSSVGKDQNNVIMDLQEKMKKMQQDHTQLLHIKDKEDKRAQQLKMK